MTNPSRIRALRATPGPFDLGEGVVWDDRAELIRWVDIREGRVLSGRLVADRLEIIDDVHLGQTASAVALASDGGLLVAGAHGLIAIDGDGRVSVGPDVHSADTSWRLNDGIVDPQGRFVVGTLALDESAPGGHEVLLRISPDGQVETLRTGLGMSNGLGFSPDGTTLFHVDTVAGTLSSHSYGPSAFDQSVAWSIVIDDFPHFADGMTVDANGDLWVALWGGSRVQHYSPTGRLIDEVTLNATQPTCAGFVAPGLNRLAITSARKGLESPTEDEGALYLADVRVCGKPEYRWAGSTSQPYWSHEDRTREKRHK